MARLTLTDGELTVDVSDRVPWLTRRRLAAWEEAVHRLVDHVSSENTELSTNTELADRDVETDDEDGEDEPPAIGFNSRL